jgi:hypothetical protein
VDTSWFDRYVGLWLQHPFAGGPQGETELKALLDCYSPDVLYEDVPSTYRYEGHDGIQRMCTLAYNWSPDVQATPVTRQTDGTQFALESEFKGTLAAGQDDPSQAGRRFTMRVISVGRADSHGLVTEHRDYWAQFVEPAGSTE